ncbi:MAG: recombinase family protein [Parvularculaceae bacterium]|nr:recombinase family protein [Parvularculaceae bacterium]
MTLRKQRFAIYTRKSSEEGLEQDFNSLHAQREACEAYIASQRHEGWRLVNTAYDDGGLSGGTMERPALTELLADIDRGLIDGVVVYKVDRLTRSLTDFARIVEHFDARSVSFVSVTQSFNTTSSMGRLTLNMLLSFAQFEREVTGERIRDKISQSKAKGLWMGGWVPFGYEADGRTLRVVDDEAATVRWLFERYLDLRTIPALVAECGRKGIRTPPRVSKTGNPHGERPLTRGYLHKLLSNPLYAGKIRHAAVVHEGKHKAIVDGALFDAVQKQLSRRSGPYRKRTGEPLQLLGRLVDDQGTALTATHAKRGALRYHYYVGGRTHGDDGASLRLPARKIEDILTQQISAFLGDEGRIADAVKERDGHLNGLAEALASAKGARKHDGLSLLTKAQIDQHTLVISIALPKAAPLTFRKPLGFKKRGVEWRMVIGENGQAITSGEPDRQLIKTLARAFQWQDDLMADDPMTLRQLATRDGTDERFIAKHLPLASLSPKIVRAILDGTQPPELTSDKLLRVKELPLTWDDQEQALGFPC